MMEYVILQNSDIKVSRLCMGGCPMGQYGWGDVKESELVEAIHVALDHGLNFFDTADTYGLGKSEETLAKALGYKRKDAVIASKFGVRVKNGRTFYDNSPAYIKEALEASLKRLNTDYIDLYQIHYRDQVTPIQDVVDMLERLKSQGKIRAYGLSNIHYDDLVELDGLKGCFSSLQDEYSLACRKNERDLIAITQQLQITPMTWGSLGQGILTGKYNALVQFGENDRRHRDIYVNFHGEKLHKNLQIVEKMRPIAANHGVSVAAVAIRFILDQIDSSVALVGAKRPSQIQSSIEAAGWNLLPEELFTLVEASNE